LTFVILAPCIIGHFVFPNIVASMRDSSPMVTRITVEVLLVETLPYFTTGFAAFALLRYVSSKMGLDNADALGKEFEPQEPNFVEEDQEIELA